MKYMNLVIIILCLITFLTCQISEDDTVESPDIPAHEEPEQYIEDNIIICVPNSIPVSNVDAIVPGERFGNAISFNNSVFYQYKINNNESLDKIISRLNKVDFIKYAEKNCIYSIQRIPDDPMYTDFQYSHILTNCEDAWDVTTGDNSVVVAVLDTGINGKHDELLGRVNNGYRWSFERLKWYLLSAGTNSDDNGHGTHVAGIIGAAGNNGSGIAGTAWNIRLMPVKVFDSDGYGSNTIILEGIKKAVDSGVDILNMSFGSDFYAYSRAYEDAITYALDNGVIVVASMGNKFGPYRKNFISFPAAYSGVIAVGSTNGHDEISDFSITGGHISVCAPGENIISLDTFDNSGYIYLSGTSMSAPYVSGLAALLLSRYPDLSPMQVKTMLEQSAADKGEPGFDPVYGYGRVDAGALLETQPSNNYGALKVYITNHSVPVTDQTIPVLITNSDYSEIITFGSIRKEVSDFGFPTGYAEFPMIPQGNCHVTFDFGCISRDYTINITPGEERNLTINFEMMVIETFYLTGADKTDTVLTLYDDSLEELMKDDDSNPDNYSKVYYDLKPGNTYYMKVEGYNEDTIPGYYGFKISEEGAGESNSIPPVEDGEPDDNAASAFVINNNTVYNRYLDTGDTDWFTISIP
jgi:subtilisin family serine protease